MVASNLSITSKESTSKASKASNSLAASSMKKWGVPDDKEQDPTKTVLERLVWIKYKTLWWPALLYHSYEELQHNLYHQLDMVVKAQFALAIMRQMHDKTKIKVARLLGRTYLEVVEVEEEDYCEFYWHVAKFLPKACERSTYKNRVDLFLDFHRALDQIEDIFREISGDDFALAPNINGTTWLDHAQHKVDNDIPDDEESTLNLSLDLRSMSLKNKESPPKKAAPKDPSPGSRAMKAQPGSKNQHKTKHNSSEGRSRQFHSGPVPNKSRSSPTPKASSKPPKDIIAIKREDPPSRASGSRGSSALPIVPEPRPPKGRPRRTPEMAPKEWRNFVKRPNNPVASSFESRAKVIERSDRADTEKRSNRLYVNRDAESRDDDLYERRASRR